MPWKVSGVVEKRKQFLAEYESGQWTMTELCRLYGITRPTGYAVLRRYGEQSEAGLVESSRAPRWHPNQTPGEIEEQVLELRRKQPRWGPRTLKARLERLHPQVRWPAASTIGALLDREGLTRHRPKRRKVAPYTQPLAAATAPNRVWCADFKGWFRTQDGERIDPLTISDAHSRYLLRCQAVEATDTARVQAIFEAAFRECGMPEAMRSDNGPPFASRAIAGLSRLAVWWMKLGIVPERIEAGHPEQNGGMSGCIVLWRRRQPRRRSAIDERSSGRLIAFGGSTTRSVRITRWACKRRRRCTCLRRGSIRRGSPSRSMAVQCKCAG